MRARSIVLGCVVLSVCACNKPAPKADDGEQAPAKTDDGEQAPTKTDDREQAPAKTDDPCVQAMAVVDRLDTYRAGDDPIDAVHALELVHGEQDGKSALMWLAEVDRALGRMTNDEPDDVALIEQALARLPECEPEQLRADLALIVTQLRAVTLLEMRRLLGAVADGHVHGAEAIASWDRARYLWDSALRKLAARADALPDRGGEGWEAAIATSFDEGRAALVANSGDAPPVEAKAAKQQIEKGMYAVAHRLIVADAEARTHADASEALGLVDALEDRLEDRNGPGLARMRQQLAGDPAHIDPQMIERELAVAFTKRARKYCDKAVANTELGSPDAIAETWEGIVYTKVILPGMRERLADAGFDADAYLADWQRYLEAVEDADADTAAAISPRLVEWNCAYQDQLGIAACTASANETE